MRALLAVIIVLAGCSGPQSFYYPNGGRDGIAPVGEIQLPDNTVIQLPDKVNLKRFLCADDNTFCFDERAEATFRSHRNSIGLPIGTPLWRI